MVFKKGVCRTKERWNSITWHIDKSSQSLMQAHSLGDPQEAAAKWQSCKQGPRGLCTGLPEGVVPLAPPHPCLPASYRWMDTG